VPRRPDYLWEIVEDTCGVCGKYIRDTLRFLCIGVCADCAQAPKALTGLISCPCREFSGGDAHR
jgi:hypothetical protein